MSKKTAKDQKRSLQATANIISQIYDVLETFESDPTYYSLDARKLAAKIIDEWCKDLKVKIKKVKRPKKADIQLAAFLEGYSKFLL